MSNPEGSAAQTEQRAQLILAHLVKETLKEKKRSRRWSIFWRCLIFGYLTIAFVLWALSMAGKLPMGMSSGKHTAVVNVHGVIADGEIASVDPVIDSLEAALEDNGTVGVILDINSPGGSPVQSGIIYAEIQRLRAEHPDIPIHAVVGDIAASGGYYIAAAAENIYADQASIVGSIGVRMDSFGAVEALDKLGIERRLLTAGEYKGLADPFLPVDSAVNEHLTDMLETVHNQFINAVKIGRGDRLVEDNDVFSGLIWSGEQALKKGLVDQLADRRQVAREVFEAERLVDFTYQPDFASTVARRLGASFGATIKQWFQFSW